MPIPDDLVPVGHIAGPFGVQGWVRVRPYSTHAQAMLESKRWWLDKPQLTDIEKQQARWQGEELVAQLVGIVDREAAESLKGAVVQISRRHFPPLEDNEYYWVDLIGLPVENLQGEYMGTVSGIMESGAHPILRVDVSEVTGPDSKKQEMLVPFVNQFVKTVDLQARLIQVDWQLDY
jgi:16S rRNA processing protein RimM